MQFDEYQSRTADTAIYPDVGNNIIYPTLGLVGEAGEIAEKVKKIIRDQDGRITADNRLAIAKELGDVLWYVARVATEIGYGLDVVAQRNLGKLAARKARETLHGSGDDR